MLVRPRGGGTGDTVMEDRMMIMFLLSGQLGIIAPGWELMRVDPIAA